MLVHPMQPATEISAPIVNCSAPNAVHLQLTIDTDATFAAAHRVPGQYVHCRLLPDDAQAKVLALTNPPGQPTTLLLKEEDAAVREALLSKTCGPLGVSLPQGPGFLPAAGADRRVVLAGAGTGAGPLAALLETWLATDTGRPSRVTFLLGARHPDELCFRDAHARWRAAGVEVRCVVSQDVAGWSGARGRVQQHLPGDVDVCYWAGPFSMGDELRASLGEHTRLLRNF